MAYCTRNPVVTAQYTYKTSEQFKLFYLTIFFFFYFCASKYFLDAYQAHQMNIFWHQDETQKGLSDISTAGYVLKEIKRSRVEHVHFIGSKKHYLFVFKILAWFSFILLICWTSLCCLVLCSCNIMFKMTLFP